MRARSAEQLLHLPVRLHGIQLGRPVDLLLDADRLRVVGFEVRCGDGEHRVLPLAAADVGEAQLAVQSALLLLDEAHASFYRRTGVTLSALLGSVVEQGGRGRGVLRDLLIDVDGTVESLVVETDGTRTTVSIDESIRIVPAEISAA